MQKCKNTKIQNAKMQKYKNTNIYTEIYTLKYIQKSKNIYKIQNI